jgi:hypothetical protein
MPGDHFRSFTPLAGRFEGTASGYRMEANGTAGNLYRHDYEDVAADFVWETVKRALPPLRAVIEIELKRDV